MSAAEQCVDPDTQLASYRLWVQHETGRILLAFSKEEAKYKAALLARISHPNPETVPMPDSDLLNKLQLKREEFTARAIDADHQLLVRGIPKDFLELVYLNDEHQPSVPQLALVGEEHQPDYPESMPAENANQTETPKLTLVL